jgi:hypothetical protein
MNHSERKRISENKGGRLRLTLMFEYELDTKEYGVGATLDEMANIEMKEAASDLGKLLTLVREEGVDSHLSAAVSEDGGKYWRHVSGVNNRGLAN